MSREKLIWIPIADINYEVNQLGQIRHSHTKRIRKLQINNRGYVMLDFWLNGKHYVKSVHRIVATAFLPVQPKKKFVNHIDSNRANNHYTNLEWCTTSENIKHGYDFGKATPAYGMKHGRRKLTQDQILNIRHCKGSATQKLLAYLYNIDQSTVSLILNNKIWKYV